MGNKLGTALLLLLFNVALVRLLPVADVGTYFFLQALVVFVATIGQLGLSHASMRLISEARIRGALDYAYGVLCVSIIVSLAVTTIVGIPVAWVVTKLLPIGRDSGALAWFVVPWAIPAAWQFIVAETYRGLSRIGASTFFAGFLQSLLLLISIFILHVSGWHIELTTVIVIATCASLSSVAAALIALVITDFQKPVRSEMSSWPWKATLRLALPLGGVNWVVYVLTQGDVLILGTLAGSAAVALYAPAAKLAALLMVIISLTYTFLPPIIVELWKQKELAKLQAVLQSSATAATGLVLPLALAFVMWPEVVLRSVFGVLYSDGASILRILSIAALINVMTGVRGYLLMILGRERIELAISVIALIIYVAMCSLGAAFIGSIGVAIAVLFSTASLCITESYAVRRLLGISSHASISAVRMARR